MFCWSPTLAASDQHKESDMAQNYVQEGDMITVEAAPYALKGGDPALVGSLFGVAVSDAASGTEVVLGVFGVWTLPKVAALAIAVGDVVYWDDTLKLVDKTATANTRIGVAVTAAANPSPTVNVRLTGP
jgi:predicted RecA/RadA family phage recombinase